MLVCASADVAGRSGQRRADGGRQRQEQAGSTHAAFLLEGPGSLGVGKGVPPCWAAHSKEPAPRCIARLPRGPASAPCRRRAGAAVRRPPRPMWNNRHRLGPQATRSGRRLPEPFRAANRHPDARSRPSRPTCRDPAARRPADRGRGHAPLRMRRPDALPRAAGRGGAAGERGAGGRACCKCCHAARVPVVARGAGTGLSGGAMPDATGVAAVARQVPPDPRHRPAGAHRRRRSRACAISRSPRRRPRTASTTRRIPSSQIACTIGGNVAENAGGVHCLKYGLTVHNVRRVRARARSTASVVEFGGDALDAPGYDLLALINGSEGLLAVITEVTVKLTPKPQLAQVALASFDDVAQGRARRVGGDRRRHRAGRPRDDGPGGDARGRGVRPRRLSARRAGDPAGRVRRHARGGRRRDGRDPARAGRGRRDGDPRVEGREGAPAALVGAQGGVSRGRAHRRRLLCMDGTIPRRTLPQVLRAHRRRARASSGSPAPTSSTPATATCIR